MYADLPGGDTLFFGLNAAMTRSGFEENGWLWAWFQQKHDSWRIQEMSTNLVADLKEVRSIALDVALWKCPGYPLFCYTHNAKCLRAQLRSFPKLESVMLVRRHLGERDLYPLSDFGYFEVEEKFCNINMTIVEREERYYKEAKHICRDFREAGTSEEEEKEKTSKRKKRVPEIKIVDMVRMTPVISQAPP